MPTRSHTASEALKAAVGTEVELLGWVSVSNVVGGLVFLRLRDDKEPRDCLMEQMRAGS